MTFDNFSKVFLYIAVPVVKRLYAKSPLLLIPEIARFLAGIFLLYEIFYVLYLSRYELKVLCQYQKSKVTIGIM